MNITREKLLDLMTDSFLLGKQSCPISTFVKFRDFNVSKYKKSRKVFPNE